jgi:hypothetical protein
MVKRIKENSFYLVKKYLTKDIIGDGTVCGLLIKQK